MASQQKSNAAADGAPQNSKTKGEFVHAASAFRNWIKADGSTPYKPEANRYHLYVSLACPFASRTLIVRKLKGLEKVVSVTVLDWFMDRSEGWAFTTEKPKCEADPIFNATFLREIYEHSKPQYDGKVSVPVLLDKQTKQIVSNESGDILRMLNSEFNEFATKNKSLDLYPTELHAQIDEMNDFVYPNLNIGVYKAGFAQQQAAYDEAAKNVFAALDKIEDLLSKQRYLIGNRFTEADIRLFTTLIRFDLVYGTHFKCNRKRIIDYPNLWAYTRDIYQLPDGVKDTVDLQHIVHHYYESHEHVSPFRIVPIGPILNLDEAHGRDRQEWKK